MLQLWHSDLQKLFLLNYQLTTQLDPPSIILKAKKKKKRKPSDLQKDLLFSFWSHLVSQFGETINKQALLRLTK